MDTRLRLENDTTATGLESLQLRWYGPLLPVGTQIGLLTECKRLDMVWAKVTGCEIPHLDDAILFIDLVIDDHDLEKIAKEELEPEARMWFRDHGWGECDY